MTRARFDPSACDTVAECVKEIEQSTNAELVIVVRARSGNYAYADYIFGFLLAFAGLNFLLFSPVEFAPYWVAIDVALLFAGGALISSRSNFLRRLFTTKRSRADAVRSSAAAMFYEAGIANTDAELGVLIYLSLFERQLELIADRGVLKAVPPLEWNEHLFDMHEAGRAADVNSFMAALRGFGVELTKHLPATGENPNELPDMPRFELK
jgi:putative membrane protein